MGRKAAKNTGDGAGKLVETVTKTRQLVAEPDDELDLEADPADDADDDALAKLDELEPGGAGRYEVRRTSPAGFDGYVGTYSREELSPDRIFEEWGGGRFNIRVRNNKGHYLGSAPMSIAGKPKHKGDGVPVAPIVQQAPPQDSGMKETLVMLTTLVKSLIERPAPAIPPPPPPIDMLAVLASAKQLFKPERSEGGGIDVLLKGIELGKSLSGDGDEPGMASVFLKGFDSIKELAKAAPVQTQPRPAQRARLAPAGSVAAAEGAPQAAAPPPPPVKTDEEKQLVWIKAQCVALAGQAAKGKDPELYAEVFLDNLPPFAPAALVLETMKDPSALDKLAFLVPAVGTHRAWFELFIAHVVSFLDDDGEEDDTPDEQPPPLTAEPPIEFPGDDGGADG